MPMEEVEKEIGDGGDLVSTASAVPTHFREPPNAD
jgi:hypothetical protein